MFPLAGQSFRKYNQVDRKINCNTKFQMYDTFTDAYTGNIVENAHTPHIHTHTHRFWSHRDAGSYIIFTIY